jgi:chemotaxis protein methyltransferase CheR
MSEGRGRGFVDLLAYIERNMEFESGYYNGAYLERRIKARMRRIGIEDYGAYERRLADDEAERTALLDSLSINVTGFFRNPDAWEALRPVLRDITDTVGTARIWSAPCADGREPYSLAMLVLDDPEVDDDRVSIRGTDINPDVLEEARAGVYETSTTTDIESELEPLSGSDRYVERQGDTFRVKDPVCDLVRFERHDLIRGPEKRNFDLICCRNLLIYIDPEYKTPIFRTIRGSLRERGYLMIGVTETLPPDCRDAFEPIEKKHRIYRNDG